VPLLTRREVRAANERRGAKRLQSRAPLRDEDLVYRKGRGSKRGLGSPPRPEDFAAPLPHVRKAMLRRTRALRRQAEHVKKLRAAVGEAGVLETKSVRKPSRDDYQRRLRELWAFVARHRLPHKSREDLDKCLVDFCDFLFLDGGGSDEGGKLKAALEMYRLEFCRDGRLSLPRFARTLRGWKKAAPQRSRKTLPEELLYAIAGTMIHRKRQQMALLAVLLFSAYLRPCEGYRLQTCDVVPPVKDSATPARDFTVILAPFEREEATKAGAYDESVVLDSRREDFLGELSGALAEQRQAAAGDPLEAVPLWSFTARAFLEEWRAAVQQLRVGDLVESPYQCRHGGPSRDRLMKLRSLLAVKKRGRWAADSSVRVYEQSGRVQETLHKLSPELVLFGNSVRENFGRLFRGGMALAPPAVTRRSSSAATAGWGTGRS